MNIKSKILVLASLVSILSVSLSVGNNKNLTVGFFGNASSSPEKQASSNEDAGEFENEEEEVKAEAYEGNWEKTEYGWTYISADNSRLTGWNYIPSYDSSSARKWYYFDKNGFLYPDVLIDDIASQKSPLSVYEPYSNISKNRPESNLRHVVIPSGWYSITEAESDEENVFFIKNSGEDEYRISVFNNGAWDSLGVDNPPSGIKTLNFARDTASDAQKWNIIQNADQSYTFINVACGAPLNIKDDSFRLAANMSKDGQKVKIGEKLDTRPEFYGAVGDGVADDTEAIRYAVNSADKVTFCRRYNTSRTINIKKDGVTMLGDNGIVFTHPEFITFRIMGKDVTVDSMIFKGNYSKDESSNYSCVYIQTDMDDEAIVDYNANIVNCEFIETGLRGVHIHSARVSDKEYIPVSIASNVTVRDCLFDTYKIGVCCSGPDNVLVENCTFNNGYFEHITFDWRSRYCKAYNNHFLAGERGVGAIGLDAAEDCEIKGNEFHYTVLYGIKFNNETGTNKNITVSDNIFSYGGGKGGICFNKELPYGVSAENVTIMNNTFDNKDSESVLLDSAKGTIKFDGNKYLSRKPTINDYEANIIKDF